jgi:hypothetical protein
LAQGLVVVPSPQVSGGSLTSTAAITHNDIWAVGGIFTSNGEQSLAEHFNGTSWSAVPTPPTGNGFTGVAAAASNDVWAVTDGSASSPAVIEHWNGANWSVVSSPTTAYFTGVTAPASNNVWAVGSNGIEHFNGTNWSIVSSPTFTGVGLSAISADSVNDIWAVGTASFAAGAPFNGPVALHWDGQSWNIIPADGQGGFRFRAVTALSPTDVWGAGSTFTTGRYGKSIATLEHWDGTSWSIVTSPKSATQSLGTALYGIAAVSANEVWAVGVDNSATLTEEWDGTSLKIVNSPNPASVSNGLEGVTALSDGTVVAVGVQTSSTSRTPLILENSASAPGGGKPAVASPFSSPGGHGLHVVPSPQINGSILNATAAITDNDIWAVGDVATGSATTQTLAEHFDGTSWSVVPTPSVKDALLDGVAGAASNDVWAVGSVNPFLSSQNTLIEHFNGTSWSMVSAPNLPKGSALTGVTAPTTNNVWAVGYSPSGALVEHFDGTTWSIVSSPAFSGVSTVNAVSADSSTDVWAVGGSAAGTVSLHWDGTTWTQIPTARLRFGGVVSVAALSPSNVWAVGTGPGVPTGGFSAHPTAVIEHFDGTSWSVVPSPNPNPQGNNSLVAIAAVNANDIWAVGHQLQGPFTEHWDGTRWSIVATPSGVANLIGMTALGDGTVVAVGEGTDGSAVILHS